MPALVACQESQTMDAKTNHAVVWQSLSIHRSHANAMLDVYTVSSTMGLGHQSVRIPPRGASRRHADCALALDVRMNHATRYPQEVGCGARRQELNEPCNVTCHATYFGFHCPKPCRPM